jgi:hypothetical protein
MTTISRREDRSMPGTIADHETITSRDARYALDLVEAICRDVGPGVPASAQEWRRAAALKRELEAHLGAGAVVTEEFTVAPRACLGVLPMCAACMGVAAVLNMSTGRVTGIAPALTAGASLAFAVTAVLLLVLEFLLSLEVVDGVFPKARSVNVIGTLRGPGTTRVRRILLLSGHHDSAPANTWLRLLGRGAQIASTVAFIGLFVMVAMSAIQLAGAIRSDGALLRVGTLRWGMLVFPIVPAIVYSAFFTTGWKDGGIVPGAADNLSACAVVVAMARFLVRHAAYVPADTEIRFVTFGSEEAGLRGSRRYVARHLDELRRADARLLNVETVAHPEIGILTSDVNGAVGHSPEMVRSVVAAAERAGVPYRVRSASLGVITDAAPFSRAGLAATTLLPFKTPEQMVAFYHQERDRPDVLTPAPLLNVLKLALEWIRGAGAARPV